MNMVKIAELKNNLSRYLGYVREGGEVLVFDRDTPVARIVPFAAAETGHGRGGAANRLVEERLADMERQGLIKRGNPRSVHEWLEKHRPAPLPAGSGSVLRALLDEREEDRR